MHDDEIEQHRARLARLTGPARLRSLAEGGRGLMARAWRGGMGSAAAKADLDESAVMLREARGYLDPADTSRAQLAGMLGMVLGWRILVYDDGDRDEAIEVLLEPVRSAVLQPAVREGCCVILGQLYVHPATRAMRDPATLLTGARGRVADDLDQGIAWFRRVVDGPPVSPDTGRLAAAMLAAAQGMRGMFGGAGGFDPMAMVKAFQELRRLQKEGMPSFSEMGRVIQGEVIDYPVMMMPGPEPAAPHVPRPRTAPSSPPAPSSPVTPPHAVPPPSPVTPPSPARPASSPGAPPFATTAPAGPPGGAVSPTGPPPSSVRPVPEPEPPSLDELRRLARQRLVRGADPYTAMLTRLRPGTEPLPVTVVDDLVALATTILHRGGDQPGDRVLAAFALLQRSRQGPGGEWDDDPAEAGRHLRASGDGLVSAPASLVAAALTLAETVDEHDATGSQGAGSRAAGSPAAGSQAAGSRGGGSAGPRADGAGGSVLEALGACFTAVRQKLEDLDAEGLVYPRPGGAIALVNGRFRPLAEGDPLPRRAVAVSRRRLAAGDEVIAYVPTAAHLLAESPA